MTPSQISKIAGRNPLNYEDRKAVAKCLGITTDGIYWLETLKKKGTLKEELEQLNKNLEDSVPEAVDENNEPVKERADNRFKQPITGFDVSINERVNYYLKWIKQGRILLTFKLITSKQDTYGNLNTILGHVNPYL